MTRLVEKSRVSADEIAAEVIRAVEKRRAYLVTKTDARWPGSPAASRPGPRIASSTG